MILADTKLEFGFIDGEITLIDELLTPTPAGSGTPKTGFPEARPTPSTSNTSATG